MRLNVRMHIQDVLKDIEDKRRNVVPKAAARAINRAIDAAKTTAAREIAVATKIKQKDIRIRLTVKGATPLNLVAVLTAHPYSPNLGYFNARQNKAGVAASAWEGRKTYKGAFLLPSGRAATRTTSNRFPIKGLRGPSVPKIFMREDILTKIDAASRQRFRSEFQRELLRRIAGPSSGS